MTTGNILTGAGSPAPPAGGSVPSATASAGQKSGGVQGDAGQGAGVTRVRFDLERDRDCARLPLTDLGNAYRWRLRYGANFRFCAELGWFAWDGKRWKLLSEEKDSIPAEVNHSIERTVLAIRNEAALVAASGCAEPASFGSKASQAKFWIVSRQLEEEHRARVLKGDEDGSREDWLREIGRMDSLIDLSKEKFLSTTIFAHARTSQAGGMPGRMVKWIKGFPDVVIRPDQMDADRMAINVNNGTLRFVRKSEKRSTAEIEAGKSEWKTGDWQVRLDDHNRDDMITKLAPVEYRPRKACPVYDQFIERVQPDEAMRRFIHQWGGMSLTGDISEQKLAFFYGEGSNGKGTWVELVAGIAGDYAGSIPIESFLDNGGKRRGDQATPDIARLPGVRFLRVSEPEKGASLNEGLVKMITGGDPVDARHLNKGFFTFLPSFKMTISGNHKPNIKDTSDGIWRRMQLVPWGVKIPKEERDRKLNDKLQAEASGVFNRLLEGLLDWLKHGLIEPDQVRMATQAYRDDSDDLGRFLTAICEVGEDPLHCRVRSSELYELYVAWAESSGGSPWKIKGFNKAMQDKGFQQKQSNGMWWLKVQPRFGVHLDDVKQGKWPDPDTDSGRPDPDEVPVGF